MIKKFTVLLLSCLLLLCSCEKPADPVVTTEKLPDELPQMQISFFDVGKADFILISCDGRNMIVDAGYKSSKSKIKDELKERGVKNVDIAVATHNHKDHIGSMAYVIEKYNVKTLYISQIEADDNLYEDMKEAASLRGCSVVKAAENMTFSLGYARFKVLSPNAKLVRSGDENEASTVIRMDYGDVSVLFMADAMQTAEATLAAAHKDDIAVDVIKIGHHGTDQTCTSAFLQKTGAKYAVISTGDGQEVSDQALQNISDCGMQLYRTDVDGDITMITDGKTFKFETAGRQ